MLCFSIDRKTAIEEGFYIDTYRPLKQSIAIPNIKDTIRFDSAWTEHSWQMERRLEICLLEHKVKGDSYNFCMPFSTSTSASDINSYPFELKQLQQASDPYYDRGSYLGNRFNFGMNAVRDTIKVVVEQKQNDTIATNRFVDTVMFIRTTSGG